MNRKINKGLITLSLGLLSLAIFNCNEVNTGKVDLSQIANNQIISTVESSAAVQNAVSLGQKTGVLQLAVSDFQVADVNAAKGRITVASVEVSVDQSDDLSSESLSESSSDDDSESYSAESSESVWVTVSNYGVNGKTFEIIPGDLTSYPLDTFLVPAGNYHQVRVKLIENKSQVFDGIKNVWHKIKTPSAHHSGLKLQGAFRIENSMKTILGFNLSLEKEGNRHDKKHHENHGNHNNAKNSDTVSSSGYAVTYESTITDFSESSLYLIKPVVHIENVIIVGLPPVGDLTFSPVGGFYNADQNVAITSATSGATICYTTDGSLPACDSIAACIYGITYSQPVTITSSSVINAVACKTGYTASALTSSAYTIDKPPVTPGSFLATAINSSQVNLSWSASTDDLTAQSAIVYEICQGNTAGSCLSFTPVYVTAAGDVSYSVTGLSPSTSYYFAIRARDLAGNVSVAGNEISALTGSANSWVAVQGFATGNLSGISYNGSQGICVGERGTSFSSFDGLTWSSGASPDMTNLNSVAGDGKRYVAVGDMGRIMYSTYVNGILTWSIAGVPNSVVANLNSVFFNGVLYVAVGDAGVILYSRDGQTWASAGSPSANNLRSIAWTGKQFIVAGDAGTMITSADGTRWINLKYPAVAENLYGIAVNGTQIIVVGLNGVMLVSTDNGKTFNPGRSPVNRTLFDITWDGVRYVAVGTLGAVVTSPDGLTWKLESQVTGNDLKRVAGNLGIDGKVHDFAVGNFGTVLTNL